MKKILYFISIAVLATACIQDLDQTPSTKKTDAEVYATPEGFRSVLAKIYASFCTTGQELNSDNDLSSNNGQDFFRGYFNLQEAATDEMAATWLSGDDMDALSYMQWDANESWVADTYYHLYYTIALCNSFLQHTGAAEVEGYALDARFLRALCYDYVLDLFRQGPFVDETMEIGLFTPEAYDAQQLFDYIESELTAIAPLLPGRTEAEYGRASKGAAYAILSRLYLNAETYGCGAKYTECIEACKNVIAEGYTLDADYSKLFNASNNLRTDEIILAFAIDAENTVTWGSTTYLVCGECSSSSTASPALYGVESAWSMFRVRGEFYDQFTSDTDVRKMFYTDGQEKTLDGGIDDQTGGYFGEKWSNLTDDGVAASATASVGAAIDWPLVRLAEVYLTAAEAQVRGGQGLSVYEALDLVNQVRTRAKAGNIVEGDMTLDFLLAERARELWWECHRRTDLVRFGKFTGNGYIWQWKGGVVDGTATDSKYDIYPIPAVELSANPNLHNKNY